MAFVMVYNSMHQRSCITQLTCFVWFVGVSVPLSAVECIRALVQKVINTWPFVPSFYLICVPSKHLSSHSLHIQAPFCLLPCITTAVYYLLPHSLFLHLFSQIKRLKVKKSLYFYSFVKKKKIPCPTFFSLHFSPGQVIVETLCPTFIKLLHFPPSHSGC